MSRAYRLRHDLGLSLTTNGTRLHHSDVRALLVEHYAEITISVDGDGAAHDKLRGKPGLYDALARAVKRLAADKRAAGKGPRLRANVVLMRHTIAGFAGLCRDLTGWGIEEITFNQLGGADRPEFFPANRLLPEQARAFSAKLPALRRELATLGVLLRGADSYLERIIASSRGELIAPQDCAPGRDFLFIDEAGRIAPCAQTPREYGVPLESIDRPAALEGLPGRFGAVLRQRRALACADCHSTQHHGKFAVVSPRKTLPAMQHSGPPIETLTRRLLDTPPEFLAESSIGGHGVVHVDALAGDIEAKLGLRVPASELIRFSATDTGGRNRLALAMLAA